MAIKAIIFDFIGVLMHRGQGHEADQLVEDVDRRIGSVTDDESFDKSIESDFALNRKERDNLYRKIANIYTASRLINLLSALRTKYRLAILNNGTALTWPYFKEHLDTSIFDEIIISGSCGFKKPDTRIYLLAASKLGLHPDECIFIDDNEDNTKSAAACGMKTMVWKGDEDISSLIEYLKYENFAQR